MSYILSKPETATGSECDYLCGIDFQLELHGASEQTV
jgi:hypothetical protein